MANRFPAVQWYTKEWLSSAARRNMTLEAQAVYFNLLNQYWESDCKGLPADTMKLAKLGEIPTGEDKETAILAQILPTCFVEETVGETTVLHNPKLRGIYKAMVKLSKARSKAGKAPKQKPSKTEAKPKQNGGLQSSVSGLQSSPSEEDLNKEAAPPTLKSGSPEALIAAEYVRMNPGIIGIEKATPIVAFYLARFRRFGIPLTKAQEAVNSPENRGTLIWEIFNALEPPDKVPRNKGRPDVHDEVKRILAGRGA